MLVLDHENSYTFSNAVIRIIDQTVVSPENNDDVTIQDFNVLIPTVQDVGRTNALEYYQPGEVDSYVADHGKPNAVKYGFGPDFIHGILSRGNSNVGLYTINLRGPTATIANVIMLMKYKVVENVPYTDVDGNQYYVDEHKQLTTVPSADATAVTRDVLHVKFVTANVEDGRKWMDVANGMNAMASDTPDDEGYRTVPWFCVMNRGATSFANNVYFNLTPAIAEYDSNVYFQINLFDGQSTHKTSQIYSFDFNAGKKYNTSYFIETLFNAQFTNLRFTTATNAQDVIDLFNKYLYTIEDYINGTTDTPSVDFAMVDPFAVDAFGVTVDEGSLNAQLTKAIQLSGGSDGTETRDELFRMFFAGEILGDIASPLRYRISYIPDIGYDVDTKDAIVELVKKRIHMTTATLMVGGYDGFQSAILDHQARYWDSMPNIRQLAKCQSAMMMNEFAHRTMLYPCTYFDTMALMDHFATWGHPYQPFAGANARWRGYIEDTMTYPAEDPEYLQSLHTARVNIIMKDSRSGGYLSDQLMDTQYTSDQTEFNNAFLISNMLYDLVNLVHYNHFKFNEAQEVSAFNEEVNNTINLKYAVHSASLSCTVARVGTVGMARFRNRITVRVDLKDINKYTDIDLYLVDE